jgi:hypothetical protein
VLDVLPGKQYLKLLPAAVKANSPGVQAVEEAPPDIVRAVSWAVCGVSRRLPVRSVCFHRGIAAQRMLMRRGLPSVLHFGAARAEDGNMQSHVWVTSGATNVVGVQESAAFEEIARFPSENARVSTRVHSS